MNRLGSVGAIATGRVEHIVVNFLSWVTVLFFGICGAVANFVSPSAPSKFAVFLFFGILFYLAFASYGIEKKHVAKVTFFWFLIAVFVPFIIPFGVRFLPSWHTLDEILIILKVFSAAGPLWMVIFQPSEGGEKTKFLILTFIGLMLLLPIYPLLTSYEGLLASRITVEDQTVVMNAANNVIDFLVTIPGFILDSSASAYNASREAANRTQTYILTGKSFEEQVDDNAPADMLGLKFKSLDFSNLDAKFREGQEITSWAVLEASSLDTPINIETYCKLNPKTEPLEVDVSIEDFTVYQYDLRDIICTVPIGTLEGYGTHELRTFANFDYTVSGYVRRYFIKQSELTELQKNRIDPYDFYNIPSSDEAAKYTNGPIQLSVIKNNLLQGIDMNNPTSFIVGIRFDTNAQFSNSGLLKNVSTLVLALPEGFSIKNSASNDYACSGGDVSILSQDACQARCVVDGQLDNKCAQDCQSFTHYKITVPTRKDAQNNNEEYVKTPSQISCTVESSRSIFDDGPIVTKSFRAYADYSYQISTGKSFTVLEDPDYVGNDFTELSYCPNYYSAFGSITTQTTTQIQNRAKEFVNAQSYGNGCTPVMKGMVAFNYRSGSATGSGIGATGIDLQRYNYVMESSVSQSEIEANPISHTNAFLQHYLANECLQPNDKASIDCALNYFYCAKESSCASTEVIMSLANEYAKEN